MNFTSSQTDVQRNQAIDTIKKSFALINFPKEFVIKIKKLILDDVHLDAVELKNIGWQSIFTLDNSGTLDTETDDLIEWLGAERISSLYSTSLRHLSVAEQGDPVLVIKIDDPSDILLNQIDLGTWMFGDISPLAARRIADWRADIWFSNPLCFLVISEHDGFGTTTIAGPPELIKKIKVNSNHDFYTWQDGVVPAWHKGAAR